MVREFEKRRCTDRRFDPVYAGGIGFSGVLTAAHPTDREQQDLDYGLRIAREIGRLDIGQTVIIKEGAVVALEAIEGTDACIERAGTLTGGRGAVMVKIAKPTQDLRFDLPTIGPGTITAICAAGMRAIGIEAGRSLILEPERVIQEADRNNLVIVGLPPVAVSDDDDARV
ncbi:MAG: LpxI family protein [Myxococcota bacterium]